MYQTCCRLHRHDNSRKIPCEGRCCSLTHISSLLGHKSQQPAETRCTLFSSFSLCVLTFCSLNPLSLLWSLGVKQNIRREDKQIIRQLRGAVDSSDCSSACCAHTQMLSHKYLLRENVTDVQGTCWTARSVQTQFNQQRPRAAAVGGWWC